MSFHLIKNITRSLQLSALVLTGLIVMTSLVTAAGALAQSTACQSEYVVEPESGLVLVDQDSDTPRPPASMTKLMSAYVIYNQIKSKQLKWDDPITVSANASKIGGSQVYLKQGEVFTTAELFEAMLIQSANDAATALAEHIAGTEEAFAELMNDSAKKLGMTSATFITPHGLPPSQDQSPDLASAKDFAKLALALIREFPEILVITSKDSVSFRNGTFEMRSHNNLLRTLVGVDGLKTGFYAKAGFCITATGQKNGARLIAVAMNCPTSKIRDAEVSKLLTTGWAKLRKVELTSLPKAVGLEAAVSGGMTEETSLVANSAVSATVLREDLENITVLPQPCSSLTAPVSKGDGCGIVTFKLGDRTLGTAKLGAENDVAKIGLFDRAKRLVGM